MIIDRLVAQFQLVLEKIIQLGDKIREYYQQLPYEDLALQIIATTILIIFVITVMLSIAVIVLRTKNAWKAHRLKRLEAGWDQQLMEIIFSDEPLESHSLTVPRRQRQYFLNYLYQYAQRLQGAELERIKQLSHPFLKVIVKGVRHGYPELRARNINILGTFGLPQYLNILIKALKDKSPIVSMTAAWSLALPQYPEHCRIILPVLNKFDTWSMSFLSSLLAGMGAEAAPDLRETLADTHASTRVRIACAEALKTLGDLASADLATRLLVLEEDAELQAALLRLLGEVGVDAHRDTVKPFLKADAFIVRLHALSSLGQLGVPEDGELIRDLLADSSNWVALHAARTLLSLQREDILEQASASDQPYAALARQVLVERQQA